MKIIQTNLKIRKKTNFPKDLEKTFVFFWTNDIFTNFKKRWFFAERTIFWTNFWKKTTVFFTERTIFLNEQFYWTILQWEKERYRWKKKFWERMKSFFEQLKKLTKWFVHKWWTNKIKIRTCPLLNLFTHLKCGSSFLNFWHFIPKL